MSAISVHLTDWAVLSSIGTGRREFAHSLQAGIASHRRLPVQADAAVDRLSALAMTTADQLVSQHPQFSAEIASRTAVVLGTSTGSIPRLVEMAYDSHTGRRGHDIRPMSIPSMVPNAAAGRIAISHGCTGPNTTVAAGLVSGLQALSVAARFLRLGHADSAIAGAVEELSAERMIADRATRDRHDRVAVPSAEACALIYLEHSDDSSGTALLGARYGYSTGSAAERQNLLARLVRALLEKHRVSSADIGHVYMSQALGTPLRVSEQAAVRGVLDGAPPADSAIADLVGDTHSATGALQISAALANGENHSLITALGRDGETAAMLLRHG